MALHSLTDALTPVLAEIVSGGGYVSIFKSVVLIGILLLWCKLLAWASTDAKAAHLSQAAFNIGNLVGLIAAYAIVFLVPLSFWLIVPIVLLIMAGEVAVYLRARNKVAGLSDLKQQWDDYKKGMKRAKKSDTPGAVQLIAKSGPLPVPEGESPDRPAYDAAQLALGDALKKGADQIDISPSAEGMKVKYIVDCVSYDLPAVLDAAAGPAAISYIKAAAGMNVDEKRKPQTGTMKLTVEGGEKRDIKLQSAGTTAGEFIRLMVNSAKRHSRKMPELGFSEAQMKVIKESIADRSGVVLLCTPKGQGLTQLMYGVMRGHDAFMEHMHSIERDPPETIEGLTPNVLAANATPDEEAAKVDWVGSQDADVIMMDRMESPKSAASAIRYITESERPRRLYVGMRAGSTAEAIEQWRKLLGTEGQAQGMAVLKMVICGRVLRKLCAACKESYTPDPNTLRKLNMNPEKVSTLFKARETPLRDPKGNAIPCEFCKDLRFTGRTGVFEVLVVTDEIRAAIAADGGKPGSNFKTAFRKGKNRYLQEEALGLVESGDTSVQEVLRVLRPPEEAARPAAAPAARPAQRPAAAPGAPKPAGTPRPAGTAAAPAAPGARPAAAPGARPPAAQGARPPAAPGSTPRPPTSRPKSG
ncbi:ATPase, T2SS/T4P/T4SS family [Humisphaera borealis]|uniref:Flp pilus assembly complex ATPase component TadA n=1 Tax=Humisphaera borealis TaxID=2807512 RepID=A0A7M2WUN1_9BACT|nr:ATPase, T2SS/T4P/T4SS family [Humisphaera borealis]QOV89149.1 Flp pilus assembly complex ATPase component TadA [Humisphaera borealis]